MDNSQMNINCTQTAARVLTDGAAKSVPTDLWIKQGEITNKSLLAVYQNDDYAVWGL